MSAAVLAGTCTVTAADPAPAPAPAPAPPAASSSLASPSSSMAVQPRQDIYGSESATARARTSTPPPPQKKHTHPNTPNNNKLRTHTRITAQQRLPAVADTLPCSNSCRPVEADHGRQVHKQPQLTAACTRARTHARTHSNYPRPSTHFPARDTSLPVGLPRNSSSARGPDAAAISASNAARQARNDSTVTGVPSARRRAISSSSSACFCKQSKVRAAWHTRGGRSWEATAGGACTRTAGGGGVGGGAVWCGTQQHTPSAPLPSPPRGPARRRARPQLRVGAPPRQQPACASFHCSPQSPPHTHTRTHALTRTHTKAVQACTPSHARQQPAAAGTRGTVGGAGSGPARVWGWGGGAGSTRPTCLNMDPSPGSTLLASSQSDTAPAMVYTTGIPAT